MSKEKNYWNGGCITCEFAQRDERGRFLSSCSGYSNCSYEEYKGQTDITEEEKDQQLSQLKAENERLKGNKANDDACVEYCRQTTLDLNQQLKEKDNEIAEVKRQLKETKDLHEIERFYLVNQAKQFDEMRKTNTKQICEKIRDFGWNDFIATKDETEVMYVSYEELCELLDQIDNKEKCDDN